MAGAVAGLAALGTLAATPASATVWSKNMMAHTSGSGVCLKVSGSTGTVERQLGYDWTNMYWSVKAGETLRVEQGGRNPWGGCEYSGQLVKYVTVPTDDLTNYWYWVN
ncbi:hypothetical protein [Streptomyces sp. SD15]